MEFCELNEMEFSKFCNTYKHQNFWQSNEMLAFEAKRGWNIYRVGLKSHGNVIAAAALIASPVFLSYSNFRILRGCMLDYDNQELIETFLMGLQSFLKQHKCLFAHMDPYISYRDRDEDGNVVEGGVHREYLLPLFEKSGWKHEGFDHDLSTGEPRWMSVLQLDGKSEQDVLNDMNVKTRQNIYAIKKNCIKCEELTMDKLSVLKHFVDITGDRRAFYHPDLAYYETLFSCFCEKVKAVYAYVDLVAYEDNLTAKHKDIAANIKNEEAILEEKPTSKKHLSKLKALTSDMKALDGRSKELIALKAAYDNKIPLAAALFVINQQEVVYLFSGSDDSLKKWKGPYAIQWYMIQYAMKHQIPSYNFYGISGDFSEQAVDYGVYMFKKGFHAKVVELPGDFTCIVNPKMFTIYQFLKKIKNKGKDA